MTPLVWTYTVVLAFINYPFVFGVDWYARNRPVRPVFQVSEPTGQRAREKSNSLVTTPIHAILFACFIGAGALRTRPETVGLAIGTFILVFLWTELWHYVSHIAMHTRTLHFIHKEHHRSHLTEPWTSVSFSLPEKFVFSVGILGGLALVSRWQPLSAFGVFAYYVLYFYTNTLGHANIEIRNPGYYRRFMGKIFNTPSYHALHHARYVRNYGLITPWFDQLFATVWTDVPEVQSRAASRKPLLRLAEKLQSTEPSPP